MVYPFSEEECRRGVALLKNNEAEGRDDILVEQMKNVSCSAQMTVHNAQHMPQGKQNPDHMETIKYDHDTEVQEGTARLLTRKSTS